MPDINMVELKDPDNPLIRCLRPGDPKCILDGFLCNLMVVVVIHEDVQVDKSWKVVQVMEVGAQCDVFLGSIIIIASISLLPHTFLGAPENVSVHELLNVNLWLAFLPVPEFPFVGGLIQRRERFLTSWAWRHTLWQNFHFLKEHDGLVLKAVG